MTDTEFFQVSYNDNVKMLIAYRSERGEYSGFNERIRKGTLRAIIKQIGASVAEFMDT